MMFGLVPGLILAVVLRGRVVWSQAPPRCEKITAPMCQNLGYNITLFPNFMGHNNQWEAVQALEGISELLEDECSPFLRLFVCSVFVPLCSEHVPGAVPACRGLCEEVQKNCIQALSNVGLHWPAYFNCSRFPDHEPPKLCMQQPPEDDFHGSLAADVTLNEHMHAIKSSVYDCPPNAITSDKCSKECYKDSQYTDSDRLLYEVWAAVWSLVTFLVTSFSLLTFLTQPKRFRWPARPILYLSFCGFFRSVIYLIRWIIGPLTCTDGVVIDRPTENLTCTSIALMLVYIDVATSLWWSIFCLVWYLSAAKEWSTEAIEKISTRLHAVIWSLSSIPIISALISRNIETNELTGFCEVPSYIFVIFQIFCVTLGSILAILTSVALKNVRKALLYAGRSPFKLERLIWRLCVISIGICLPLYVSLLCNMFVNLTATLLKIGLQFLCAMFASFWVFSSKTFKSWNKILRPNFQSKAMQAVPVTKV